MALMKRSFMVTSLFIVIHILFSLANANEESRFTEEPQPPNLYMDQDYTTVTRYFIDEYGPKGIGHRGSNPRAPGDYYLMPSDAYPISLDSLDKSEIASILYSTIDSSLFDKEILRYIQGYYYELANGDVKRREYYLRYASGDTIFVISGWIGKFLSFYRVIPNPDSIKYTIDEFQDEAKVIAPLYVKADTSSFIHWDNGDIYYLENINRNNFLRIRNYFMYQGICYDDSAHRFSRKIYNLVEVTRFIDENIIPPKDYVYTGEISVDPSEIYPKNDSMFRIEAEPLNYMTPNDRLGFGIRYQIDDGHFAIFPR